MNSNNAAFTKLENCLQDKLSAISKDEKDLYESVLHKHYQIIQTFLEKINSLYIKNQEFENTMNIIQERLDKIEGTNTNIHYEFRTTHLMMDKRLNSITADYANMNEQIRLLRTDIPVDSFVSTQHLSKSAFLKNRSAKHRGRPESSSGSLVPKIVINHAQNKENKHSKIESSLNIGERGERNLGRMSQTCKVIFPHQLSAHIDSESQSSEIEKTSCKDLVKDSAKSLASEQLDAVYNAEWVQNEISKQMDQFTTKINDFTQQWNEEKLQLKEEILGPEAEKYFTSFEEKMDEKMNQFKETIYYEQERIKKEICIVNETSLKNIGALQYKLSQKVQNHYFEQSMNNLTTAITAELASNEKHYSNKNETQRAIRFLENKINKIIKQEEHSNSPKDAKQRDPYLRINKCISQKNSDFSTSEKIINSKSNEHSSSGLNNMNFSSADVQKHEKSLSLKENKDDVASKLPRKINWKVIEGDKLDIFKIESEAKIRKTSIIKAAPVKYRSSYSNFVQPEKVVEKQWKEKVVKILNTGNRKKVKVTFH